MDKPLTTAEIISCIRRDFTSGDSANVLLRICADRLEALSSPDSGLMRVCESVRNCVRCEKEAANYCDNCALEYTADRVAGVIPPTPPASEEPCHECYQNSVRSMRKEFCVECTEKRMAEADDPPDTEGGEGP